MLTLFSKNACIQCKQMKRFLDANDLKYEEVNIDENPLEREKLIEEGFKALPVLKGPNLTLSGYNPDELILLLKA